MSVKISVDEWIFETTHPHKHVAECFKCNSYQVFFCSTIKLEVPFLQDGDIDFCVDEWVSEVTHSLTSFGNR